MNKILCKLTKTKRNLQTSDRPLPSTSIVTLRVNSLLVTAATVGLLFVLNSQPSDKSEVKLFQLELKKEEDIKAVWCPSPSKLSLFRSQSLLHHYFKVISSQTEASECFVLVTLAIKLSMQQVKYDFPFSNILQ